jgi:hypothetical protein
MRHVLVVAFHYPPDNSSTGVLRTLKFTQYMGNFGWRPHVLTVDPEIYSFRDPDLHSGLPSGIEVTRTRCLDIKSALGICGRYPGWLAVPDRFNGWLISGYRPARRILANPGVDVIYSTQPVPTAHLLAWRLKRVSGLPWVADFRDPWIEETITGIRGRLERWLERRVVLTADCVICNTPLMREAFLERYPDVPQERFVVITNGYDEADFLDLPRPAVEGPLTIAYPGVVDSGNRNPLPLIESVGRAVRRGDIPADDVALCFLGGGPYLFSETVSTALRHWKLDGVTTRIAERVPYRESLGRLARADVLIVLSEPTGVGRLADAERAYSRMMVPAKVYEFVRLQRQILALVSGGAVREMLESLGAGCTVSPNHPEVAAQFLARCYADRHRVRNLPPAVPAALAAYDRRVLTKRLVGQFDALTGQREVPHSAP